MLEKKIKFTDYDDNVREEVHYFNLNKSETIKWMTTTGEYTLDKVLLRLAEEKNGAKIMAIFEDLIYRSYGRKSLDGRKFEKSEEIWLDFYQTEAYSELFSELVTDAKKAAAFVNGIIPSDIAKEVTKTLQENREGIPDELKDYVAEATPAN
jgi:hypothetical protein